MKTFEIELRYAVCNQAQLASFIAPLAQISQQRDIDIYLDTSTAQLYQQGIFIRTRNNRTVDIKFNRECLNNPALDLQDYCEEHAFTLPLHEQDLSRFNDVVMSLNLHAIPAADFAQFQSINQLQTHYIIDKVRTSYNYHPFTIAIDQVAELGTFLEIECMANNIEQLDIVKAQMHQLLQGLALKPLRTGYGTLLLRAKNFDHYLKGRFILEEDKIHRSASAASTVQQA